MNKQILKILNEQIAHLEYYNRMAPFPVYSTEYIMDIKHKIKDMEKEDRDYDTLPVTACKYCSNLYLEVDDAENDVCMRCGSTNEIIVFTDIFEYLNYTDEEKH